ncbi:MAG: UbiA family prenyltransferase [Nocardioides sp.]
MSPRTSPPRPAAGEPPAGRLRRLGPVLLVRTAHPRLALATALALAAAAALSGRTTAEVGMVLLTVLVGQAILGWANDLVDRHRDASDERVDKPIAQGLLDPGDVAFALSVGVLLVVPLAISHGLWAGISYLAALAIGLLGNLVLRRGWLSWVTWAASFALYPAFLSYGGFAGDGQDTPPEIAITALAAALGVCVHVLVSLPGLVLDNENGVRHLPLRIAIRVGAAKLLWGTVSVTALVLVGLLATGSQIGLRQ